MKLYLLSLFFLPIFAAPAPAKDGLRLVKTSQDDPGVWVTEEEKITRFVNNNIKFIDETDPLPAIRRASVAAAFPTSATHQSEVNALIPQLNMATARANLVTYSNFYNRYYRSTYGVEAANWLYNTVRTTASANTAITVRQVTHSSFSQKSVIASIPGTGTGVVIVSAHLDSVGNPSSGRSPGADDDGSGTVTILEVLRVLANQKYKGKNTLEFHFYAGEEGGLLGSREVMADYSRRGVNVLALLNQDMTGYSPGNQMAVITDYTHSGLNSYVTMLAKQYVTIKVTTSKCGYGCSDHASANSVGYPAAFVFEDVFENSNPYIHTSSDTIDRVDFNHVLQHARLTLGFLVEASYI